MKRFSTVWEPMDLLTKLLASGADPEELRHMTMMEN